MSAQRVRDDEDMLERISAEMEDRISTQPNGSTSYYQDKFMYFTELWNIGLVIGEETNRGIWKKHKMLNLTKGKDEVVRGVMLLQKGHTGERPSQVVFQVEITYCVPDEKAEDNVNIVQH